MVRQAEPFELLAEIFHHIRALRFPVDQHVKPEGLLMPDDFPDGIFQESFVGGGGEFALPVFASCLTDSLRLWIGTAI